MMIRKFLVDLTTEIPCRCTTWGRSGVASCNLFCTCTWATFGSVPAAKVSVMLTAPAESLLEDI